MVPARVFQQSVTRRSCAIKTAGPSAALIGVCVLAVAACGGYSGPPDIETARAGLPPEYRIVYQGQDGKMVLELLEEHVDSFTTEGQGGEILVTSINGITGGTEGRYWLYYVNDKAALIASSRMTTVDGDSIEWLFAR